jgi:DNA (cytosine-5)-methyltransferase 1
VQSIELFAGAGGLALGCELAGFCPQLVVEWDKWACETIRKNQMHDYPLVSNWNVFEGDVRGVDWNSITEPIDLLTGGPPCQPFSLGGKHGAFNDKRDMFPAATDAIRLLRPKAFLLENVKGLTRSSFANYYSYIQLRLTMPELVRFDNETWMEHQHRLQSEYTSVGNKDLTYQVVSTLVNAADYGIPQQRHRVFLIGFRSDVDAEFSFPSPTHSQHALSRSKSIGEYWDRHRVSKRKRPVQLDHTRLGSREDLESFSHPWRTVRDALEGLPQPVQSESPDFLNHVLQPGARSYPGHTGSHLDEPAKTLKAGDHGVPGGENMLRSPDGSVRYFTVRESARLQTFPDRYEIQGSWTEAMRQLGNAVPVLLAQKVAGHIAEHLSAAEIREKGALRRERRKSA